jgi:hypothetical protein
VKAIIRILRRSELESANTTAAVSAEMVVVSNDQLTRVCGPRCELGDVLLSTMSLSPATLHTTTSALVPVIVMLFCRFQPVAATIVAPFPLQRRHHSM